MGQGVSYAVLRTSISGIITALAALETFYPHMQWITVIIAVAGIMGIHAIPSIGQPVRLVSSNPGENMSIDPASTPATSQVQGGPSTAENTTPTAPVAPELTDPLGDRGATLMGIAPPVQADVQAVAKDIVEAVQARTADLPAQTEGLVQRLEDAVVALENRVLGKL